MHSSQLYFRMREQLFSIMIILVVVLFVLLIGRLLKDELSNQIFSLIALLTSVLLWFGPSADLMAQHINNTSRESVIQVLAERCDYSYVEMAKIIHTAEIIKRDHHIPVAIIIGIMIHETDGLHSDLCFLTFNCFGLTSSKWDGETFSVHHRQYHAATDQWQDEATEFRVYHSVEQSMHDFPMFLKARRWYDDFFDCDLLNYDCQLNALSEYATDPNWGTKVQNTINRYHLEILDD